jgi:inosine/guanosine/xanthosine phosphorylase family protein
LADIVPRKLPLVHQVAALLKKAMTGDLIDAGVRAIREKLGAAFPRTVIILGSGIGKFAERLAGAQSLSYADIPGFAPSTVSGHAGKLMVGEVGGLPLGVMAGRIHVYEGHPASAIAIPIRILRKLGVERLILTNASGGLSTEMVAGTLMIVEDHINFTGTNPLIGPNDESIGPRFPDMTDAYDPQLRALVAQAARDAGVPVKSGVYLWCLGPNFETPAEVRMMGKLGAHAVGMSTVPECLVARHCGMTVAALSLVTNLAAGIAQHPLTHEETLAEAAKAYGDVEKVLLRFFAALHGKTHG